jgi:hypothetical protein
MPWKNGYYYRNRRLNGQVVTEYIGSGVLAELIAQEDQKEQASRKAERVELRRLEKDDRQAAALFRDIDLLVKASLLLVGCYNHKGEWRRKHG